jgi:hypothetical protein
MKLVAMSRKALLSARVTRGQQYVMLMSLVSSARRHDPDVKVFVQDVAIPLLAASTENCRRRPEAGKQRQPPAISVCV